MARLRIGTDDGRVGSDRVGGLSAVSLVAEIEAALFRHLSAYDALSSLVSDRIYPLILPQATALPAITYQRIDGPREERFGGDPLAHPRIQFDSWAETAAGVEAVATQINAALSDHSDASSSPPIVICLLDNDQQSYEPETNMHRFRQDWIVWYRET